MPVLGTKFERFMHYLKISVIHLLIFIAVGSIIYARVEQYMSKQDQQVNISKIHDLQSQLDTIQASNDALKAQLQ